MAFVCKQTAVLVVHNLLLTPLFYTTHGISSIEKVRCKVNYKETFFSLNIPQYTITRSKMATYLALTRLNQYSLSIKSFNLDVTKNISLQPTLYFL